MTISFIETISKINNNITDYRTALQLHSANGKTLLLLFFGLQISACNKVAKDEFYGQLQSKGFQIVESKNPAIKNAVESSIVPDSDEPTYFVDIGMNGNLSVGKLDRAFQSVGNDYRFSYVFKHASDYFNIVTRDGKVYILKSSDSTTWTTINNGNPILQQIPDSIYASIWNIAATIDDSNTWHFLAECSQTDNAHAGLASFQGTVTPSGDFTLTHSKNDQHVIPFAGNPWLEWIPGKGILTVFGKIDDSSPGKDWYISSATRSQSDIDTGKGQAQSWIENHNYKIYVPNIHIADPHLAEINGQIYLTLSYNQNSIYQLKIDGDLPSLFSQISAANLQSNNLASSSNSGPTEIAL